MTRSAWFGKASLAFLLAFGCWLGVWTVWRVFVQTITGQQIDLTALVGAQIGAHLVTDVTTQLLQQVSVAAVGLAMVLIGVVGVFRRRWLLAGAAMATIAAANLTTQVLKHLVLVRQDLLPWEEYTAGNSLPSGHTTAAASAAVAAVLIAPRALRGVAALLGAAVLVAFGYATLVGQWHRPSDVLAGYLVCLGWGFAALGLIAVARSLSGVGSRDLDDRPAASAWPSNLMMLVGAALLVVWIVAVAGNHPVVPVNEISRSARFVAYASAVASFGGLALFGMGLLSTVVRWIESERG